MNHTDPSPYAPANDLQNHPQVMSEFPQPQKMTGDTTFSGNGTMAVLKFHIAQPSPAQSGQYLAFGPQEKIASMARFMASVNREVTSSGFPHGVMMGIYVNKEHAQKMRGLIRM